MFTSNRRSLGYYQGIVKCSTTVENQLIEKSIQKFLNCTIWHSLFTLCTGLFKVKESINTPEKK